MRGRKEDYHAWSATEARDLVHMRETLGWSWKKIAEKLNLPERKCWTKYANLGYAKRRQQLLESGVEPERGSHIIDQRPSMPERLNIDRAARDAAREHQTLTAAFFGDPPPGYSALDKRRANA